ncbi:hypothetical protein [Candidatus Laterigemmans baculatus]|uniref:hypothetical protein n=1 Tax=Candidatus Laterigemmans baculatus TaxID=2770505 RepID=UPI001F4340C2|nr:hypothetical protein [Candidatus Laterigemmans baculatus]
MRTVLALLVLLAANAAGNARGGEWLTAPSFYTHDPHTGLRTSQYAAPPPAAVPQPASFRSSGYTHLRSSIQVGQSADNYHRVEQWGPPVRPYGEWRFPYRPYSVPYPEWGAPLAGLNLGGFPYGYPGYHPGPGGHPGHDHPGDDDWGGGHRGGGPQPPMPYQPYPSGPRSPYPVPPYADGYYPSVPFRPRLPDRQFYWKPNQAPPQSANP